MKNRHISLILVIVFMVLFIAIIAHRLKGLAERRYNHDHFIFGEDNYVYLDDDAMRELDKIQDDLLVIPDTYEYKLLSLQVMPNKMYILNYGNSKDSVSIQQVVGGDIIGVASAAQKVIGKNDISIRCGRRATISRYIAAGYEWTDIRWHEDDIAVAMMSHTMDEQSMVDIANSLIRLRTGRHICR